VASIQQRRAALYAEPLGNLRGEKLPPSQREGLSNFEGGHCTVARVAWGITGGGHYLKETFSSVDNLSRSQGVLVTTFLTKAGVEVVRAYGLWDGLSRISPGGYYQEVFTDEDQGASAFKAGRLYRGMYHALLVSPATANTVAKIVYGISDSLVTNAVAEAQRGSVPVFIVPTDLEEGIIETTLPHRLDGAQCVACQPCPAAVACPYSAFKQVEGRPVLVPSLCIGCGLCLTACRFNAIKRGEKVQAKVRPIDARNAELLQAMEGITVLEHPSEIEDALRPLLLTRKGQTTA